MPANSFPHPARRPPKTACISAILLAIILVGSATTSAADITLHVTKTRLIATTSNGTALPPEALIGTQLSIGNPNRGGYTARINTVQSDPQHPSLTLYDVSFRNPITKQWEPLCHRDPLGLALAVAIPGTWTAQGRYIPLPAGQFTFTCTAGAHVKCLRMGYLPWETTPAGESLAPYHHACTRMMRADYCGNGTPFTLAGRTVHVIDTTGQRPHFHHTAGTFEAVWGVDGAVCLRRPRVPETYSLETILETCPHLAEHTGEGCTEDILQHHPDALLANRS